MFFVVSVTRYLCITLNMPACHMCCKLAMIQISKHCWYCFLITYI